MRIYILLPVHNRKEITRSFIECLVAQTFLDYHLILIDDGSTDGTEAMVSEYVSSLTVLRGNGDWWWAGSLQRGLDWLKDREVSHDSLVLFINDDVSFAPDYLETAVQLMSAKKHVLLLSQFRMPGGQIAESGVHADLRQLSFEIARSSSQINCLSTRGLFAYWGDILKVGDFHPKLLPHYLSDYEYTIRAHRKGLKCATSAELLIIPNHDTTGYHALNDQEFIPFLKKYFSKKSAANPMYWSSFILLTFSSVWALRNLGRIWHGACRSLFNAFLGFKKPHARNG